MDAANPSSVPTFASRTPLHIGAVGLCVRDLDAVAQYYRDLLGLAELGRDGDVVRLGIGGVMLVELTQAKDAVADDPREAGLYHVAFLMPTRADLARWVLRIARTRVPVTGASDHGVSEAIYLDDPEGNGIEVYGDRPPDSWTWHGDMVEMPTVPLDLDNLARAAGGNAEYEAPAGLRIGHIHLRVGALEPAQRFYSDGIGFMPTRRRGGALFMSSARYHHHVATNVWHSQDAGPRNEQRAGLAWFSVQASDGATVDRSAGQLRAVGAPVSAIPGGIATADPWGTRIRIVAE